MQLFQSKVQAALIGNRGERDMYFFVMNGLLLKSEEQLTEEQIKTLSAAIEILKDKFKAEGGL